MPRTVWVVQVVWTYPKSRGIGSIPLLDVHETLRGARRAVETAKRHGARGYRFGRATIHKYVRT